MTGTGIAITTGSSNRAVTQLRFAGFDAQDALISSPTTLPVTSFPFRANILVDEALTGAVIWLRVDGLSASGEVLGSGAGAATIALNRLVPLGMTLGDPASCGDGTITDDVEACDDGGVAPEAGCTAACRVREGFVCEGAPSACRPTTCGDGLIDALEQCDDANTQSGDGCSRACSVEQQFTCDGAPSCCKRCGDGVLQCDEACDATNVQQNTCLSMGYLTGDGLACGSTCALDTSRCGAAIDNEIALRLAIQEAYNNNLHPGHDVVGIKPSTIPLTRTLDLNECGIAACGSLDAAPGLTLRALGPVALTRSSFFTPVNGWQWAITFLSPNNVVQGLATADFPGAVGFLRDANPTGNNRLESCLLADTTDAAASLVSIHSTGNQIIDCTMSVSTNDNNTTAILVGQEAEDTVIRGNIAAGNFTATVAVYLDTGGLVTIDQNTFVQAGGASIGFAGDARGCVRNNVLVAMSASVGYSFSSNFADGNCSPASGHNDIYNYPLASECVGSSCDVLCRDGGIRHAYCSDSKDPGFDEDLCPGTNLVDAGTALGHPFSGSAPDQGARERGFAPCL